MRCSPAIVMAILSACSGKHSAPSSPSPPPTFAGVAAVAPASATALFVTWAPAQDSVTPTEELKYRVYLGPSAPAIDFSHAVVTSDAGARAVVVDGLIVDTTYAVAVRAVNNAGVEDTNQVALTQAPQLDIAPPRFGGARTARSESDGTLTVDWAAASDDHSPAGAMVYTVFEALLPDQFDFAHPLVVTAPGDVSARLPGPFQSDRPYYFCVRARDAAGNVDTNRITLVHGFMASDRSTPTFAGLTSAQVDSQARTCVLAWEEANDPDTPPAQIVYEVFEATSPGVYDFNAPPSYVSAPGASGMTLTDLAGDEDLNWVVRARDLGNNEDMNKAEQGGHTDVSFTANVQAIFTYNCAVVGCHVPGNPPQGLVLASGFSYGQTVNVASSEAPTSFRIVPSSPDTSYLYMKIMGTAKFSQMPAPATGNVLTDLDKDRVRRWIASGAIQN